MSDFHTPVLLKEAIDFLNVKKGGLYIDATLGGGGHAGEILKRGGKVLGIDCDPEAIEENQKSKIKNQKLVLVRGNFADIERIAREHGFHQVDGILYDLGVSSHQLEATNRGFSFNTNAKLDMRMDPNLSVTAADLVNGLGEKELTLLFQRYGEERFSKKIASAIVEERKKRPITTCDELAKIIVFARRKRGKFDRTHPATRCFQALRIAVNNEIENLKISLPQAALLLKVGGRLVVISFHSLEDRIVKGLGDPKVRLKALFDKPVLPSVEEVALNPKARSAKLRVFEKV